MNDPDQPTGIPQPIGARSIAKSWLKAIELTSRIEADPSRLFADIVEEWLRRQPDRPALISETEIFSYRMLTERINGYARWALSVGIEAGDTVCLMMPSRPDYKIYLPAGSGCFAGHVIGGMTQTTGNARIYARCRTFVPASCLKPDQLLLPRAAHVAQTVALDLWQRDRIGEAHCSCPFPDSGRAVRACHASEVLFSERRHQATLRKGRAFVQPWVVPHLIVKMKEGRLGMQFPAGLKERLRAVPIINRISKLRRLY